MGFYSFLYKKYRKLRRHKRQRYIESLVRSGLTLGKNVEIVGSFFFDPSHCFLISIGDNCTICPNVRLIAHDASTKKILGYTKIGKIEIKENCFIGDSVIILPNVKVGTNSIIGAGSVVTKDVPSEMIAAGNPAKPITSVNEYISKMKAIAVSKKVFSEEYFIDKLDGQKRQEILESIGESIGFIV